MKTNERSNYFRKIAQGLSDPDSVDYPKCRKASTDYFFALERVIERMHVGASIDPADEPIVNGDLPALQQTFGNYVGSAEFKKDMMTYVGEVRSGKWPKKSIDFLFSVADAYSLTGDEMQLQSSSRQA